MPNYQIIANPSDELMQNFDKFIEMAERGDLEKVDMTNNDARNEDHEEEDWYKIMPRHFTIFELGKLSSGNMKGKGLKLLLKWVNLY